MKLEGVLGSLIQPKMNCKHFLLIGSGNTRPSGVNTQTLTITVRRFPVFKRISYREKSFY